jgi:hypothetical protein
VAPALQLARQDASGQPQDQGATGLERFVLVNFEALRLGWWRWSSSPLTIVPFIGTLVTCNAAPCAGTVLTPAVALARNRLNVISHQNSGQGRKQYFR